MSSDESIKEKIIKNHPEWRKRYNEGEYHGNKSAIRRLIAEKLFDAEYALALEKERESLQQQVHTLELKNKELEINLNHAAEKGTLIFILSLLTLILSGIGINIVTDKPYSWAGWVMIGAACILQLAIFLVRPKVEGE